MSLNPAPTGPRLRTSMRRSFPREMASLEAIVAFVREFLAREGLGDGAAYELDLVLEELFTNLVKYGRGARGDVEISLECAADGVMAELREFDAEAFDPTLLPEVDVNRPVAERRPGGLGNRQTSCWQSGLPRSPRSRHGSSQRIGRVIGRARPRSTSKRARLRFSPECCVT